MPINALADVLERVKTWPEEDQQTLAEYARAIEAQRTGYYVMTSEELALVKQVLAEAERGEFASGTEKELQPLVRLHQHYREPHLHHAAAAGK